MNNRIIPGILIIVYASLTAVIYGQEPQSSKGETMQALLQFSDNLIEHARDKYGPKHTPLFVNQLEIDSKEIPDPDTGYYGQGNRGGAGATSNNLLFDNGLIRLFDALTQITGEDKYRGAVDEYLSYYLEHLPEPKTGFFPWGDHRGYDVLEDKTIDAHHEFKLMNPPWERYYQVNPKATAAMIKALHRHIFNPDKSFGYNRHYPSQKHTPHSMPSSGGAWIAAWAFLHEQTGDETVLEWARKMDAYMWSLRNPQTDLLASHPADPAYPGTLEYRDGLRAERTEYMAQLGSYAPNLLIAAEHLGPEKGKVLREHALAFIRAFTERMDIQEDGSFYHTFKLDTGDPLFPRLKDAWKFVPAMNERYQWSNGVFGMRAPITLAFAYRMTGEADLKRTFDALLPVYRMEQFAADAPRQEYRAGLIAQALTSFLDMYKGSGDKSYLGHAETLGNYAMKHYYVDGWFVAGPASLERYQDKRLNTWRMYSNRGGSAELALSLLRLKRLQEGKEDFIDDNPMSYW